MEAALSGFTSGPVSLEGEKAAPRPREFRKIAVFCGASSGNSPVYLECAKALGEEMVRRKIGLVYGGGNVGESKNLKKKANFKVYSI